MFINHYQIMRTVIFFLALVAMLGGGIYLASQKIFSPIGADFLEGGISPSRQWCGQLVGTWKFNTRISNPRELWVFTGTINYLSDGKFVRQVTCKFYKNSWGGEPHEKDANLGIVAGGTVEGKWKVDTTHGNWQETATDCAIVNSIVEQGFNQDYDACTWFSKGSPVVYGNHVTTFSRSEVSVFTVNNILIEGESFSDGGKKTWSFKKVK